MKRLTIAAIQAFALGMAAAAAGVWHHQREGQALAFPAAPVWEEAEWPLPPDQWGRGKYFRCPKNVCGAEIRGYTRRKLGFGKCDCGVNDDEELDRIGDLQVFSDPPVALGPGRPIKVAWMTGRSRRFALGPTTLTAPTVLSVGFNDHCDAGTAAE